MPAADPAPRPAPVAESLADYPHHTTIQTRWMDNDIYGHVNNAVYYSFFDTVINNYLIEHGGLDIFGGAQIGLAVETHCQFHRPLAYPAPITAGLRVGRLGTSSVRYELALFAADDPQPAATGYFVHVFVDHKTRRPQPLLPPLRAALQRLTRTPAP
jgi:acyl-CoA thioester hydrolase